MPQLQIGQRDQNIMQPLTTPRDTPATAIHIERFLAFEARFYALHFCGTVQIAIFAAGRDSGFGLKLDSHTLPSRRFPHLSFSVRRSGDSAPQNVFPENH